MVEQPVAGPAAGLVPAVVDLHLVAAGLGLELVAAEVGVVEPETAVRTAASGTEPPSPSAAVPAASADSGGGRPPAMSLGVAELLSRCCLGCCLGSHCLP